MRVRAQLLLLDAMYMAALAPPLLLLAVLLGFGPTVHGVYRRLRAR